jgi:nitrite reductase (NADH) large subunit
LSDDAEICGCNGVTKGTVVATINGGACSLDAVRSQCKASASCGSCTGLVESLLTITLGDEVKSGPKTLCKCTKFSHDDVRRLILEKELKAIPQVMQELHWTTPDGCASCRPALNYYLLCAWPGVYVDDQKSRFVNERLHANIQKDGTYSVVPRMWGGVTTPNELRAIADAADKYGARMVKVTGGQRLDLFGIRKEDLPAIWADLNAAGMVSGHAYGKSLRTVKTCVGSEWCRFGTQDLTGLGIALERMTWGSWMPHKFKIAVSGCPRNCAEATIKDFGVICVDSGYELHVGGNGGIHLRGTDLLARVTTEAEAMDLCAAFIQLYREQAWYLERTAPWIERVGLPHVKSALLDDPEAIATLAARFRYSQQFMQDDPWARRAAGEDPNCTSIWRSSALSHHADQGGRRMIGDWLDIGPVTQISPGNARTLPVQGRGDRHLPHHGQRVLCAGQHMPAQAWALVAGHCAWHGRYLPAAQLEHQSEDRPCIG